MQWSAGLQFPIGMPNFCREGLSNSHSHDLNRLSDFAFPGFRQPKELEKVWLTSGFRAMIIARGIEKAGSLNELGRQMGYRSRVHPGWSVVQILLGRQAFPADRLKLLSTYINYPFDEMLKHQTRSRAITPEGTREALRENNLMCYVPK